MEDKRNEMIEETEVVIEVEDYEEPVEGGRSLKGVVIGVGSVMITGATALAVKNRDKIKNKLEERKIKKLEDKGYTVIAPEVTGEEIVGESDSSKSEK